MTGSGLWRRPPGSAWQAMHVPFYLNLLGAYVPDETDRFAAFAPNPAHPLDRANTVIYRSDRNAARSSMVKGSGCSQAAKWPPLSTWL